MKLELFNDKAHVLLSRLLDDFEVWLVKHGRCNGMQANDMAALAYIDTVGGILTGAQTYLESEEEISADIFLSLIMKDRKVRQLGRNARMCAKQLATHTPIYFPNYLKLLRLACLEAISRPIEPLQIAWNGVVMLASSALPGVRSDVHRELRRRGFDWERCIVPDDVLERRTGADGTLNMDFTRIVRLST